MLFTPIECPWGAFNGNRLDGKVMDGSNLEPFLMGGGNNFCFIHMQVVHCYNFLYYILPFEIDMQVILIYYNI